MKALVLGMICVGLAAASAAEAQEASMVVKFGDLNLRSPAGAAAALSRIDAASRKFCGEVDIRDLATLDAVQACRRSMTEQAVSRMASPLVTELYASRRAPVALAAK